MPGHWTSSQSCAAGNWTAGPFDGDCCAPALALHCGRLPADTTLPALCAAEVGPASFTAAVQASLDVHDVRVSTGAPASVAVPTPAAHRAPASGACLWCLQGVGQPVPRHQVVLAKAERFEAAALRARARNCQIRCVALLLVLVLVLVPAMVTV